MLSEKNDNEVLFSLFYNIFYIVVVFCTKIQKEVLYETPLIKYY
jgi:hypothetical protein